jgi:DNA-binding NtrC family response regulator
VVSQLARLLEPLGILSIHANTGEEAQTIIANRSVHIAVVDLGIPLTAQRQSEPGGPRILELLQRLDAPPPTVVVRPPLSGVREDRRTLADALRCGAFTVLDRPLGLETMLQTMRRVVRRHYADHWPDCAN